MIHSTGFHRIKV